MSITSDFHMHTDFSVDSQTSMEAMVKGAIAKGMQVICFTDHQDKDYFDQGNENIINMEAYVATVQEMQKKYESQIDIRLGVELGLQPHLGGYYHEYVKQYPFDFVIGSLHMVWGEDLYQRVLFQDHTDEEVYRLAFQEMLDDLKATPDMDVLGHIDYVVRYGKSREQGYSYERFAPEIDAVLKYVIEHGKGIEMNMSGFKYGLGFPHPHTDVIKRYRQLGGEIITIGADGHCPEHIAYDFERAGAILQDCGFAYYTEFKDRKPIFKQLS